MSYRNKHIVVTGGPGFLGTHVMNELESQGYSQITKLSKVDYDLREQSQVRRLFIEHQPEVIIHLAARVGGILVNKEYPADFFYDNVMIGTMMAHEAWKSGVEKFVTCIPGCSYPAKIKWPGREEKLWNGFPQPESAPYAIAKKIIAVQSLAFRIQHNFNSIVLLPGNMYGPHDNFNLREAHVIPALIRRIYEAMRKGEKEFIVWGSGKTFRDFVYVRDVARIIIYAMEKYNSSEVVNISSGQETLIKNLVELIKTILSFEGQIIWDRSKPDGQKRKIFDIKRMESLFGLKCQTTLEQGLSETIKWFIKNYESGKIRL